MTTDVEPALTAMGIEFGAVEDVVAGIMRVACDESIYGRTVAIAAGKEVCISLLLPFPLDLCLPRIGANVTGYSHRRPAIGTGTSAMIGRAWMAGGIRWVGLRMGGLGG